jgi:hypothetical protein
MKSGKHRFARLALGFAMVALAAWPVTAETVMPAPAQGAKCDHACLKGFVDKYLDAVVAHDPGRLPWTSDVMFTESTIRLNLGEGLWSTATGVHAYKVYIADRYSNVAGFCGVMMERAEPRLLSLRLLIRNGEIKEIETLIARQGLVGPMRPEMATQRQKPIWGEVLKPSGRVPRLAMLAAAVIPIAEALKIKNGRLYEIEAVMAMGTGLPYGGRACGCGRIEGLQEREMYEQAKSLEGHGMGDRRKIGARAHSQTCAGRNGERLRSGVFEADGRSLFRGAGAAQSIRASGLA